MDEVLGQHNIEEIESLKAHDRKSDEQNQNNITIVSSKSYLKWFVSSEGDEEEEESEYDNEESEEDEENLSKKYFYFQ